MFRISILTLIVAFLIPFEENLKADPKPSLDPGKTAVLIMDYQNAIINGGYVKDPSQLVEKANRVLSVARKKGLPVIYIVVGFRPGYPEIHPNNSMFGAIKKSGGLGGKDPKALDIHPGVSPQAEDIIVTKHRVGAFLGTDLDMILRAKGVNTLVFFGIATSGVVLSTVRYSADADYKNIILTDLCSDRDPDVHRTLMEKVFPRQADLIGSDEFLDLLSSSSK
ncbi:cysteine hydrolase [Leptospira wolffii]|uniref:cysteine hydrolase family protein n=1 Tax=Leptospira wolffii TaxID=409998 RepID=UPI0003130967|nr:isochorismatase family cysteine hydrolase [Leptospira wolffii]EPG67225.1 isochorismatase family protein [Leptospira wolffii serovar Khorat str. Khorat-H2]TGL54694.1 cysteine hydrolase [Leptospira wolffii]